MPSAKAPKNQSAKRQGYKHWQVVVDAPVEAEVVRTAEAEVRSLGEVLDSVTGKTKVTAWSLLNLTGVALPKTAKPGDFIRIERGGPNGKLLAFVAPADSTPGATLGPCTVFAFNVRQDPGITESAAKKNLLRSAAFQQGSWSVIETKELFHDMQKGQVAGQRAEPGKKKAPQSAEPTAEVPEGTLGGGGDPLEQANRTHGVVVSGASASSYTSPPTVALQKSELDALQGLELEQGEVDDVLGLLEDAPKDAGAYASPKKRGARDAAAAAALPLAAAPPEPPLEDFPLAELAEAARAETDEEKELKKAVKEAEMAAMAAEEEQEQEGGPTPGGWFLHSICRTPATAGVEEVAKAADDHLERVVTDNICKRTRFRSLASLGASAGEDEEKGKKEAAEEEAEEAELRPRSLADKLGADKFRALSLEDNGDDDDDEPRVVNYRSGAKLKAGGSPASVEAVH